jgi:hypothetical protein
VKEIIVPNPLKMSHEHYDGLLSKIATGSVAYSVLKNGIVESQAEGGNERRVIDILCEPTEAEVLLGVANELWPKAASEIKNTWTGSPSNSTRQKT